MAEMTDEERRRVSAYESRKKRERRQRAREEKEKEEREKEEREKEEREKDEKAKEDNYEFKSGLEDDTLIFEEDAIPEPSQEVAGLLSTSRDPTLS
ncbi:hypothetical protein B9479_007243 [Cryptococcus floricola]|uniref:Uncharacterized protein n=1 Tax=Cryptococcus floricola TaxID=2591691 RepID=A0A5D3AQ51_9TREE|nr:hypothetical protein B9479_007243 [Cryptococcus floricola]